MADSSGASEPEERAALRRRLNGYEPVEELSSSAWLLRRPAETPADAGNASDGDVVVAVELLKPSLGLEVDGALTGLLAKALGGANASATWFSNDRYHKQTAPGVADLCVEVVCPATKKDVEKRRQVTMERCLETRALYDAVTVPTVLDGAAERDKWVANIIEGRSEQEHVVEELSGDGIVVVKDYKWQKVENTDDLYYLCLFSDLSVRSLRDLRGQHLPLLQRILEQVVPGLAKKHGIEASALLAYVHYHPTFWYFHVHIVNSRHAMFSAGSCCGDLALAAMDRFHKLETIVALLQANSDNYAAATLPLLLAGAKAAKYKKQ